MKIAIALIIIILFISLIGTLFVTKNEDAKYGESTKRNTINLSIIYVLLFVGLTIGVVWYIVSVI
ncbi:hypothetical protein [Domibacillus epiphyticus]|uniref:Uncharacterized protein n=1 Tax=Domibacillus epiphyticus TaxID=1714355 RepID=A0A1V2ABM9_9BACI|nr:hypothetical protein [Domibacillus epiphyticus]OMP68367.1 hypothetical protein BTO28_01735 [Domibacillus epiphyticus]